MEMIREIVRNQGIERTAAGLSNYHSRELYAQMWENESEAALEDARKDVRAGILSETEYLEIRALLNCIVMAARRECLDPLP